MPAFPGELWQAIRQPCHEAPPQFLQFLINTAGRQNGRGKAGSFRAAPDLARIGPATLILELAPWLCSRCTVIHFQQFIFCGAELLPFGWVWLINNPENGRESDYPLRRAIRPCSSEGSLFPCPDRARPVHHRDTKFKRAGRDIVPLHEPGGRQQIVTLLSRCLCGDPHARTGISLTLFRSSFTLTLRPRGRVN
jgi:hypothetical protein